MHQDCNLPAYSTKEIHVVENLRNEIYSAFVQAEGKEMCSKAGDSKAEEAAQRDLDCLWKNTKSPHTAAIQVPKLLGLIITPEDGKTIGFWDDYTTRQSRHGPLTSGADGRKTGWMKI